MPQTDPRIDAYIEKAAGFARPILRHLRAVVHRACPDVVETMKWNFPHFEYKGMLCSMAAFSAHCAFGFWKAALMTDAEAFGAAQKEGMGHLGRIRSRADLPPDRRLTAWIREAMDLNDRRVPLPRAPRSAGAAEGASGKKGVGGSGSARPLEIPAVVREALARDPDARAVFDGFPYSHRKEYVEWIIDAKTAPTREKRIAAMLEWLREGKSRNWKYERKKR